MKKRYLSRVICIVLSFILLLSCTACGDSSGGKKNKVDGDFTFPLEEEVTFTFMIQGVESTTFKDDLEKNVLWKQLKEETNVNIEFIFLGTNPTQQLALLANSGKYGDVLMGGPVLNSITASLYYESGMFVPITDYVNEEYMPNFMERVVAENPEVLKVMSAPDGEYITLPQYNGLAAQYLESPIWINQKWLTELGLSVPKTVDEFTNVLQAFATKDPNGNGKKDEIPLMLCVDRDYYSFQPFMGMFGVATKSGNNDAYVQVKDGKVEFQPTTQGYKDALKYFRSLYEQELIYAEVFTASQSTAEAKMSAATPTVGVYTFPYRFETEYMDDYVPMLPPTVEGYDTNWYVNPGANGIKNLCFVTDKCENVGVLMSWLDKLYTLENAVGILYGTEEEGRVSIDENNKYTFIEHDLATSAKLSLEHPTLSSLTKLVTWSMTTSDYESRIAYSRVNQDKQNAYDLYSQAGILNDEIWPRPYLAGEDANTISDTSTDIFYTVDQFLTKTISGVWDIDEKWDSYVKELEALELETYVNVLQRSYDEFVSEK